MKKIGKLDGTMSGLLDSLAESLQAWKPEDLKREIQFSADLAEYL